MAEVGSCSYRSGSALLKWGSYKDVHAFPVAVNADAGELLSDPLHPVLYDTCGLFNFIFNKSLLNSFLSSTGSSPSMYSSTLRMPSAT